MTRRELIARIEPIVGPGGVVSDPAKIAALSSDLGLGTREDALLVVRPADTDELVACVRAAHQLGLPIAARGGGRSYTSSHTPSLPGTLLIDTRGLRAIEIHAEDMRVDVGVGVTWEELLLALAKQELRTPFWGPLSGRHATIGGTLSQNAVFYGSAGYGFAADSVLGLTVVLADGRVLRTGSAAHPRGVAFMRHHGPDLTGLFLCDSGAHGVKASASLALIPSPAVTLCASFAYPDAEAAAAAMARAARLRVASDVVGFDPYHHALMERMGFGHMARARWSVHTICEGHDLASVGSALDRIRHELAGAPELPGTIGLALRADPFGGVRTLFAHARPGQHLPVHSLVPLSCAAAAAGRLERHIASRTPELAAAGIQTWSLQIVVGRAFLVECAVIAGEGADLDAAAQARREISVMFEDLGAVHMQLGRFYPYREALRPEAAELLTAIRAVLDPDARLNPGVLAL